MKNLVKASILAGFLGLNALLAATPAAAVEAEPDAYKKWEKEVKIVTGPHTFYICDDCWLWGCDC